MIIVEGPDGAGKTTLVQKLVTDLKLEIRPRHCTSDYGPLSKLDAVVDADFESLCYGQVDLSKVLYDRHSLISELIYGPSIRHGELTLDTAKISKQWHDNFRGLGATLIVCLPPYDVCFTNVVATHVPDTDHKQGLINNFPNIWWGYFNLLLMTSTHFRRVLHWDYTQETSDLDYDNLKARAIW